MQRKRLINLGCGPFGGWLPDCFANWTEYRVDADACVYPDLCTSITDLSGIATGSADAVWLSHCLEHVYLHEVRSVLSEAHRVLAEDGFLVIIVPDLEMLAGYLHHDRLTDPVYVSASGPITAHDILFGYAPALERGQFAMAHRCGFTKRLLARKITEVFRDFEMRRNRLDLAAIAFKGGQCSQAERDALFLSICPSQERPNG